MQTTKEQRIKKVLLIHSIILITGILYYILITITAFSIPCPIHTIIGIRCPGCGLTTMMLALINLDFIAAFNANQLLFCLLPLFIILDIYLCYKYIKHGTTEQSNKIYYASIILITILLIFAVLRNIFNF